MSDLKWIEDIKPTHVEVDGEYIVPGTRFLVNSNSGSAMTGCFYTIIVELRWVDEESGIVQLYSTSTSPQHHCTDFTTDIDWFQELVRTKYYQPYDGGHIK
jgi:hypothetical protein